MFKKRSKFLVFGKPYIGNEEIKEVVATLHSGWWGTGPKTELFENEFKKYEGAKYGVSVNSATAGLHLALKTLGVGPRDEVITTPLTFVSDANVIVHCGAKPVFADIDINTWNIDPKEIEKKITKKTKVIMPVHLYGRPCDMDSIYKIAKKYKLFVVNDAAHAVEAEYHGKKIGAMEDISVFSFYATKNLATGEGGMITTNNKNFAGILPIWRLHGLSRDAWKRYSVKHFTLYEALVPGFKYNLTDIASSIGLHQLRRIESNSKVRAEIWKKYSDSFKNEPLLTLPAPIEKNTRHAMHLYAIALNLEKLKVDRNEFVDRLIKENIGSGVHFAPIHTQPYYKKTFGYKKGDFPNAEFVGERIVSLPLGANLSKKDVSDVIRTVKYILNSNRKK